ncbi:MAG TPA: DinB family protein [Candidatus Dormibacteraeota bacterium]|nr:DinB family protein [Candidatus Dormibacteraeota bacterium]
MKKWNLAAAMVLVAGLISVTVQPALAGNAAQGMAPSSASNTAQKVDAEKAEPSTAQIVVGQWNDIGRKLVAMAEDFPESKYDFKPTPAQRTFAEQLLHVAGSMYFFTNPAQGMKEAPDENPARAKYKTKADVVAFVKKSVEDGASAIKTKGDKGLAEWYNDPESKQQVHFSDLAYGISEHSGEHYGQLVVYYRLSGLVPPESRPKK